MPFKRYNFFGAISSSDHAKATYIFTREHGIEHFSRISGKILGPGIHPQWKSLALDPIYFVNLKKAEGRYASYFLWQVLGISITHSLPLVGLCLFLWWIGFELQVAELLLGRVLCSMCLGLYFPPILFHSAWVLYLPPITVSYSLLCNLISIIFDMVPYVFKLLLDGFVQWPWRMGNLYMHKPWRLFVIEFSNQTVHWVVAQWSHCKKWMDNNPPSMNEWTS